MFFSCIVAVLLFYCLFLDTYFVNFNIFYSCVVETRVFDILFVMFPNFCKVFLCFLVNLRDFPSRFWLLAYILWPFLHLCCFLVTFEELFFTLSHIVTSLELGAFCSNLNRFFSRLYSFLEASFKTDFWCCSEIHFYFRNWLALLENLEHEIQSLLQHQTNPHLQNTKLSIRSSRSIAKHHSQSLTTVAFGICRVRGTSSCAVSKNINDLPSKAT